MNVDAAFKENHATMAILARDEMGRVQGMWFEKAHVTLALEAEARAIFKACAVAKDKNYYKIIIESDCKMLVDAILGYVLSPWS